MDQYEKVIQLALKELDNHPAKSIRSIARDFDVSEATLRRRRAGGRNLRMSHEHLQRLSPLQEKFLVEWILEQDHQGHPPSHARTREMASRILRMNGDTRPLGNNWVAKFINRNRQVASVIGRRPGSSKVHRATQQAIQAFQTCLEAVEQVYSVQPEYDLLKDSCSDSTVVLP